MKRSVSAKSRLTTVFVITGVLFLVAVLLWAYRTGRLTGSADVRVDQNRVTMNFDELSEGLVNQVTRQYTPYGVRFSSEPATYGDSPLLAMNLGTWNSGVSGASGILAPSTPHVLTSATVDANGANPAPAQPIVIVFVDPGDPNQAATTNFVQFALGGNLNQYGAVGGDRGSVRATAYGANRNVLGSRTVTSTGTHTVSFQTSGIAAIVIQGSSGGGVSYSPPPIFAIDDLEFTMPGDPPQLVVTADKSEYRPGETVTLTYRNPGTKTVDCATPVALTVSGGGAGTGTGAPGQVVYRQEAGTTADPLTTNTSRTVAWNQTANTGTTTGQVAAGTYSAQVTCGTVTAVVSFAIAIAAPTPQAALTTSKASYSKGETVNFTLQNTGTLAFDCPSAAPFVIQDAQGQTVFQPTGAAVVEAVGLGAAKTWSWNQQTTAGSQVPAGGYQVAVACGQVQKSASFSITDPATPTPTITFSASVEPTSGDAPLAVTARLTTSSTEVSKLLPLLWDFGDGTTYPSGPATQAHTYTRPGTYAVTLRVADGRSANAGPVTVRAKTVTPVSSTPPPPASSGGATLTNTSSGPKLTNTSVSPATLVSTGGNLLVNLGIATLLSLLIGSWLLRRRSA